MSEITDFADTAAIIENLDLMIAVDTSTAHLAGALNKPVWILSRYDQCWRWLIGRDDSPWYPSARLFRQEQTGEWDGVIERAADALKGFALNPSPHAQATRPAFCSPGGSAE
ncbi:TPR repeat [Candidatus Burkholderia humilis]|nr:TPR repeat [Candidatus Burkholderia humilis]